MNAGKPGTFFERISAFIFIGSQQAAIGLSLFFIVLFNKSFFIGAWNTFPIDSFSATLFALSLILLLWLLTLLLISCITLPYIFKPLSIFLLIAGSFAAYFMDTYGVFIDREMLRNAIETDADETMGLISFRLFAYVLILGILPSLLVIRARITWNKIWIELAKRLVTIIVTLIVSLLIIFSLSSYYASFFRNHKEVRILSNPLGFVYSAFSLVGESNKRPLKMDPISQGAFLGAGTTAQTKPVLLIFVIGETARAANFSLGGYERNTNPLLKKKDILYFNNFSSCGTSTAVSLPCMFSSLSRSDYSDNRAKSRHGLLDFMHTAGIDVFWRNNNSGCKGTCDRVAYETFDPAKTPGLCKGNNCFDEVLLQGLDDKVTGKNQVIVLHQKGSHGPEYDQRYPDAMRVFTPVCKTNQLQACTQEEVVNAYDNTIFYTDYFLDQVINWLIAKQDTHNTMMVYVSDHGESLGENGIYLHGLPYSIAPKFQTEVPFIFWGSNDFYRDRNLSRDCLSNLKAGSYSHDNLFHSLLGLLDVKTEYYESKLDIFAPCITPR